MTTHVQMEEIPTRLIADALWLLWRDGFGETVASNAAIATAQLLRTVDVHEEAGPSQPPSMRLRSSIEAVLRSTGGDLFDSSFLHTEALRGAAVVGDVIVEALRQDYRVRAQLEAMGKPF